MNLPPNTKLMSRDEIRAKYGWDIDDHVPWHVSVTYTSKQDRWHVEPVKGGLCMRNWSSPNDPSMWRLLFGFDHYSIEYPRAKDLERSIALCAAWCEEQTTNYRRYG